MVDLSIGVQVEVESILDVASNVGAMGFVLFLAHRLTTSTIPALFAKFEEATAKQRDDFGRALSMQREDFERWHEHENKFHETQIESIVGALTELTAEMRDSDGLRRNH